MKDIITKIFSISALRVLLGLIFLWAFIDKTIGLGFATKMGSGWIHGGSPTTGFLTYAVKGPFAGLFSSLAGIAFVDWLFMLGLLGIGVSLLTKRFLKLGALSGVLMMMLMYLSLLWPENNPFIDEHIVYAVILGYIALNVK